MSEDFIAAVRRRAARVLRHRDAHDDARDLARIEVLRRFIAPGGVGAEIGVHKGYFTAHLLRELTPQRLHLVDPWYLLGAEWNWGPPSRSTVDALCSILHRYTDELTAGRVVLHVGWDLEVLAAMPDASFDWVYLDTDHEYESTRLELEVLQRKVTPSGIIAGDDWRSDPDHRHHGVFRAVQEVVATTGYDLLHADDDDQQWLIRRPR